MSLKNLPFTKQQIENVIKSTPTPFHIYDEKSIRETVRRMISAFSWAPQFMEYFAVKAAPNPYLMKIIMAEGCGADCSSLAELLLAQKCGLSKNRSCFPPTTRQPSSL